MHIGPNIEKPTRDPLGRVMRGELEELGQQVYAIGDQRYLECVNPIACGVWLRKA